MELLEPTPGARCFCCFEEGAAMACERISSKILAVRREEVISLRLRGSPDVQYNALSLKRQNLHACAILPRLSRRLKSLRACAWRPCAQDLLALSSCLGLIAALKAMTVWRPWRP
jgi:N-dimethylarginine dimethylaminohydrolase